jgi:hypothetical protein
MSRKTITLEVDNEGQAVLIRRYHALLQEMADLALSAPHGRVIDVLEDVAVDKGRDTMRATLEQAVQQRIDAAEKKGRRCGSARVVSCAKTEGPVPGNS